MATIKDIAKLTGYSIGTVSRVINHRPDVSQKARETIEKVIQEQHFAPNANAKFLKRVHAEGIAIFVKGYGNLFLTDLLEKVQKDLHDSDTETDVVFVDESVDEVREAIRYQNERSPKGFLFLGGDTRHFKEEFDGVKVPSVLVSQSAADMSYPNLSSYYCDDIEGSSLAAETLIDAHHTKIGVISGYFSLDDHGNITAPRLRGFVETLHRHGIPFDLKKQLAEARFELKDAYRAAEQLLIQNPDLTAIFAHSDIMALGAYRAVRDHGLRVPEDISLIGYDGIEITRYIVPRLSSIRQNTKKLADAATMDILMRIRNPRHPGRHVQIPLELMKTDSIRDLNEP
jgi:LacI family transcriptional regulator